MWIAICRDCEWVSGEAFLRSSADYMATVHAQDNAGHRVVVQEAGKPPEPTAGPDSARESNAA